jgi:hypothetical protein
MISTMTSVLSDQFEKNQKKPEEQKEQKKLNYKRAVCNESSHSNFCKLEIISRTQLIADQKSFSIKKLSTGVTGSTKDGLFQVGIHLKIF